MRCARRYFSFGRSSTSSADHSCRDASSSCALGYVGQHHCIRTNFGMIANIDRAKNFRPGPNVYMASDPGRYRVIVPHANCDLLENQAIWTDCRKRMNDYAIRMWNSKTAFDLTVDGNIGARNHAPPAMP
jgi:hypothetical protein